MDNMTSNEQNYNTLLKKFTDAQAKKKALEQKQMVYNSIANPNDPLKLRLWDEISAMNPKAIGEQYNALNAQYNIAKSLYDSTKSNFQSYENSAKQRQSVLQPNAEQDWRVKLWYQKQIEEWANVPEAQADRTTLPEWLGTRYSNTVQSLLGDAATAESMGDAELANTLKYRANQLESLGKPANMIMNTFSDLGNTLDNFYAQYSNQMSTTEKDLLGKLSGLKDIVESQYWPQWAQTKRIEETFGNLKAATAARLGNVQAQAGGEATRTGTGSVGAGLLLNQADQKAQEELANIGINEAQAYDNLYKVYDEFLNNFLSQYGNVKNAFTTDTIQKLLAYKTTLATQAQDALRAVINQKFFQSSGNAANTGFPGIFTETPAATGTDTDKIANTYISPSVAPGFVK